MVWWCHAPPEGQNEDGRGVGNYDSAMDGLNAVSIRVNNKTDGLGGRRAEQLLGTCQSHQERVVLEAVGIQDLGDPDPVTAGIGCAAGRCAADELLWNMPPLHSTSPSPLLVPYLGPVLELSLLKATCRSRLANCDSSGTTCVAIHSVSSDIPHTTYHLPTMSYEAPPSRSGLPVSNTLHPFLHLRPLPPYLLNPSHIHSHLQQVPQHGSRLKASVRGRPAGPAAQPHVDIVLGFKGGLRVPGGRGKEGKQGAFEVPCPPVNDR